MSEVTGKFIDFSSQSILEEVKKWSGLFPTDPKMGYLIKMVGVAEAAVVEMHEESEALEFCLELLDESIFVLPPYSKLTRYGSKWIALNISAE